MFTWAVHFIGLWLLAMVWIARDINELNGTVYFCRNLRTEFIRSLPRSYYWHFGSRLVGMCLLQAGLVLTVLAFAREVVAVEQPIRWALGVLVVGGMLVAFGCQLPRFHPYFRWQLHRRVTTACRQLSGVVAQFEASPVAEFTDAAAYVTQGEWTARHPRGPGPWWPGVVPIAHCRSNANCAVIFPLDFEWFVAWRLPSDFVAPGDELPFAGPMETTFTLLSSKRLPGSDWTLLRCKTNYGAADAWNTMVSAT